MRTRLPLRAPAITVLFVSFFAISSCGHRHAAFDLGMQMGDGGAVTVPLPLQQMTAVHEAAHAVAIVGYFGPGTVRAVMVRTLCCGGGVPSDVGMTKPYVVLRKRKVDDYRKAMVMMYAGYEAELEHYGDLAVFESPQDHADARNLAEALARELEDAGMAGNDADALAERTMRDARIEARAFVRLNAGVIRKVAGALLMQPEINGKLVLEGYELNEALKGERIVVPKEPRSEE